MSKMTNNSFRVPLMVIDAAGLQLAKNSWSNILEDHHVHCWPSTLLPHAPPNHHIQLNLCSSCLQPRRASLASSPGAVAHLAGDHTRQRRVAGSRPAALCVIRRIGWPVSFHSPIGGWFLLLLVVARVSFCSSFGDNRILAYWRSAWFMLQSP